MATNGELVSRNNQGESGEPGWWMQIPGNSMMEWVTDPEIRQKRLEYGFRDVINVESISKAEQSRFDVQRMYEALIRLVKGPISGKRFKLGRGEE